MDIAKYIGLFLLKNKYCCLQGLGNLELKRNPAKSEGAELAAPTYYAKFDTVGSLDDAFPNFVATNEQVSIAKASNEISEFIRSTKATVAAGGSVSIPSIGAYTQKNNQLFFELDPAFSMPAANIVMPIVMPVKTDTSTAENVSDSGYSFERYNNYNKPKSVNWNLVAFWGILVIIVGSVLFWGLRYFMNQQSEAPAISVVLEADSVVVAPSDSLLEQSLDSNIAVEAPVNVGDTPKIKFVIREYKSMALAQKKEKQLNSYGYTVSVFEKDSSTFYLLSELKVPFEDTLRIKDSLTKILNPQGVYILR